MKYIRSFAALAVALAGCAAQSPAPSHSSVLSPDAKDYQARAECIFRDVTRRVGEDRLKGIDPTDEAESMATAIAYKCSSSLWQKMLAAHHHTTAETLHEMDWQELDEAKTETYVMVAIMHTMRDMPPLTGR